MPLHHDNQPDGSAAFDMNMTLAAAVRSLSRSRKQVAFKYDGALWSINIHDGNGYKPFPIITKNYYDPPFSVRSLNMCDSVESIKAIHYDEAGDGDCYKQGTDMARNTYQVGIVETFATNILIPLHITRVYFDALTTATEIHLHG